MKFEVIDRDGKVKMSTEHRECIYPLDILQQMVSAGYSFRFNGKRWKPGQEINDGESKATTNKTHNRKKVTDPC